MPPHDERRGSRRGSLGSQAAISATARFPQALQGAASKLIDAVATDTPFRRDGFDVVLGEDVCQRIKLATNIDMTFGQDEPPNSLATPG
jgi:hypothetical protein